MSSNPNHKPAWWLWAWDEQQQLPTYRAQGLFLVAGAFFSSLVLVWQSGRAHYQQLSMMLLLWLVIWLMSLIGFFVYVVGQAIVASQTKSLFWRYTAGLWAFELAALLYYSCFGAARAENSFWAAYLSARADVFTYCSFNLPVIFNALISYALARYCYQIPNYWQPAADILDDFINKDTENDEQFPQ